MIKYALRENPLTQNPDDCIAKVQDARVYTNDDIAEEMIKRGSSLTRADIAAYQKLEEEVLAQIIQDGGHINTPLFNISFSIGGVFNNKLDGFDKSRHKINLNINAGTSLKNVLQNVKVQKVEGLSTDPYITSIIDKTNNQDETILVGSPIEIIGSRLKFDEEDQEEGVFAIFNTGEVRCDTIIENKPSRVIVLLPKDVPSGDFTIELRTKLTTGIKAKTIKKGTYSKTLRASTGSSYTKKLS